MHTQRIHEVLAEAIVGRHLLTHPFYRRWEAGTLSEGELAAYAEQYRHIERELPVTLSAIAGALPGGRGRATSWRRTWPTSSGRPSPTRSSSSPSRRRPAPRPTCRPRRRRRRCWPSCAPRRRTTPWPRWPWSRPTRSRRPTSRPPSPTGCAATTGSTRRAPASGTCTAPRRCEHAGWSMEALAELGADPDVVQAAAIVSADSWWLFLSEREELAPAGARC